MKVGIRSNDLIYGTQINIPEWTFLLELVYERLLKTYPDLKLGYYKHSPINLHYYNNESIDKQVDNILKNPITGATSKFLPLEFEFDEHLSFEGNLLHTIGDIYNLFSRVITDESLRTNEQYINELFKIVKTKGTLFYYSYYSLLYLLYKRRSTDKFNLFDEIYRDELKVFFEKEMNKELDVCKAILANKFTPAEWILDS